MDGGIRYPSVKQVALLIEGQGGAGEAPRCWHRQGPGGVDEDDPAVAGEPEELACEGQSTLPGARRRGDERLDVLLVDERPVCLVPVRGQEHSEVSHRA